MNTSTGDNDYGRFGRRGFWREMVLAGIWEILYIYIYNFQLPPRSSSLTDSNFLTRMLFKNTGCAP